MAQGPFIDLKPVYTLTFSNIAETAEDEAEAPSEASYDEYDEPTEDTSEPLPPFTLKAHLKRLSGREAARLGADIVEGDIEILCADPMEGDKRVKHGSVATHTPDFMGLSGTLTIKARPDSRITEVVDEIGVKWYATFSEG